MRKLLSVVAGLVMVAGGAGAQTVTATFDDIPTGAIANPYLGFNWSGMTVDVASDRTLNFSDDNGGNTTVSGTQLAFINCGNYTTPSPQYFCYSSVTSSNAFQYLGGYFRVNSNADGPYNTPYFDVTGSLNGALVFRQSFAPGYGGPQFFAGSSGLIDRLDLDSHDGGVTVAVDNLAFSVASSAPEPASLALLGTGLVVLIPAAQRRLTPFARP